MADVEAAAKPHWLESYDHKVLYGVWEAQHPECFDIGVESGHTVKVVQLCFAVACLCQVLFMLSRAPNVGWEAVFLPFAEVITYFLAFMGEGVLRMADGRMFPWARMASWTVCCPVMLIQIGGMAQIKYRSIPINNVMLAASLSRLVMGISATITPSDQAKWGFFFCGCVCFLFEASSVLTIMAVAIDDFEATDSELGKWVGSRIKTLRLIFLSAWTTFPIMWVVSSTGLCLLPENISAVVYMLADMLCKNTWGFLLWQCTWRKLNGKWDREYARNNGVEPTPDVEMSKANKEQEKPEPELDVKLMGVKVPSITRRKTHRHERLGYPMRHPSDFRDDSSTASFDSRDQRSYREDRDRKYGGHRDDAAALNDREKIMEMIQKTEQDLVSIPKIAEIIAQLQSSKMQQASGPQPAKEDNQC